MGEEATGDARGARGDLRDDGEELAAEHRRLRARAARERARRSEGLQMVCYRIKLIEARMREIARQKVAPGR